MNTKFKMWLKLLLLTIYLFLIFLLSRLLEATSWYQGTGNFLSSISAIDPLKLSVKKLKQLLDTRGISYSGVVEKQELMSLVEASGKPMEDEVTEEPETAEKNPVKSTKFTCGSHFYEEVEDTKDSVWLVQVVTDDWQLLPGETWKDLVFKVSKFGVRTGVFHCYLDRGLCSRKGWTSSRLILALPQGNKAKEDVVLYSYLQRSSSLAIFQWVRKKLASSVKVIHSVEDLKNEWTMDRGKHRHSEIRIVFFSVLKSCPMFLSALAFKFTGRVKFGMVQVSSSDNAYNEHLKTKELPVYLVVTPEGKFFYGKRRGESYNFKSLELFLKSLRPEMNDLFLLSLFIVNAMASFKFFLFSEPLWKHFILCAAHVVKYNCSLFFVWLMILALFKFPLMVTCTEFLLKCLRCVSSTDAAAVIRDDWKNLCSYPFLFITFVSFATIAGIVLKKYNLVEASEDNWLFSNWWLVPRDSRFTTYFFRPVPTLTRPIPSQDMDLEVGMELLIERLAVPNLWLQPVISMDYIRDLPLWKYQGWCEADDVSEDNKPGVVSSSDDESTSVSTFNRNLVFTSHLLDNHSASAESNSVDQSYEASQCETSECKKETSDVSNGANSTVLSSGDVCASSTEKKITPNVIPDADRAPMGMLEFRECSICLENYTYGYVLCGLPCGHNFHMNCIMRWLFRDNHCCPICRWPSYKPKHHAPRSHVQ